MCIFLFLARTFLSGQYYYNLGHRRADFRRGGNGWRLFERRRKARWSRHSRLRGAVGGRRLWPGTVTIQASGARPRGAVDGDGDGDGDRGGKEKCGDGVRECMRTGEYHVVWYCCTTQRGFVSLLVVHRPLSSPRSSSSSSPPPMSDAHTLRHEAKEKE